MTITKYLFFKCMIKLQLEKQFYIRVQFLKYLIWVELTFFYSLPVFS